MISKYWRPYLVLIIHHQSGAWFRIFRLQLSFNQYEQRFRIWVQFRLQKVSVSSTWCFSLKHESSAWVGCDNGISYELVLQRICTEKLPHRLRRLCDRTHCSAARETDHLICHDRSHSFCLSAANISVLIPVELTKCLRWSILLPRALYIAIRIQSF